MQPVIIGWSFNSSRLLWFLFCVNHKTKISFSLFFIQALVHFMLMQHCVVKILFCTNIGPMSGRFNQLSGVTCRVLTSSVVDLGGNCIVIENFTASIGDLMVTNWVYWRHDSRACKQIFTTIKSTVDAMKFSNTIQLSPL